MVQNNSTTTAFPLLNNVPLVITILLLLDSLHFVFARRLRIYLPPVQAALLVLGLATVETAVFLTWQGFLGGTAVSSGVFIATLQHRKAQAQ